MRISGTDGPRDAGLLRASLYGANTTSEFSKVSWFHWKSSVMSNDNISNKINCNLQRQMRILWCGCNKCICKRVLSGRSVQPGTNFRAVHAFSEAALLLGIAWSRCSQSLITLLPFPGCTCFDAHTRQAGDSCSIDYKLNNYWSRADRMYFGSNELPSQYPQIDYEDFRVVIAAPPHFVFWTLQKVCQRCILNGPKVLDRMMYLFE